MELVDKVDKNDNIIGEVDKKEAHQNGYIHRVAAIFIFNQENKLLVQFRKKDDLLDHSVGGHVKKGESYEGAAKRELQEELGITAELKSVGTFYGNEIVHSRNYKIDHYFGLFEAKLTNEEIEKILISEDEVKEVIPKSLEDISKEMRENSDKYTIGFTRTLDFYIDKHNLSIPKIKLK